MKKYTVGYKVYFDETIEARDEDEAEDIAYSRSLEHILGIIKKELENGCLEAGIIEEIEEEE